MEHDTPMAGKYREVIQRYIFQGGAGSSTGVALMVLVKRHPNFVFDVHHVQFGEANDLEFGVVIHARPESLPNNYGEDFIEMVQDKLAEMREEFAFAVEMLKAIAE